MVEKNLKPVNNRKKRVNRTQDFEAYLLWKTLPSFLKGAPEDKIRAFGFTDYELFGLFSLKTQGDFARRFKINKCTLSAWNNKIRDEGLVSPIMMGWMKRLTPNVAAGFYSAVVKEGDAARVKLWLQWVEGWSEKTGTKETEGGPVELHVIYDDDLKPGEEPAT